MSDDRVGIRELKQNASAVVQRVKSGEIVIVTERGTPVARLIPAGELTLDDMVDSGLASAPQRSLAEMLDSVPEGKSTTILSDILRDMRRDERS